MAKADFQRVLKDTEDAMQDILVRLKDTEEQMSDIISPKEVPRKQYLVWDEERELCGGYLNKQASKNSSFSAGKWQKRWVWINFKADPDGGSDENYYIEYYHTPDEYDKHREPKQSSPLVNASVKLSAGNTFTLTFNDESTITFSADTATLTKQWVETIENVVKVAERRAKILTDKRERQSRQSLHEAVEAEAVQAGTATESIDDGCCGMSARYKAALRDWEELES
jgi:hypothetical protein